MKLPNLIIAMLTFCFALPASALQLADVEVPQQVSVAGIDKPLQLNGAGIRKKLFFDIYVAGLYLPHRQADAGVLLSVPPANRMLMHFVYSEVGKSKMDDAWMEGFESNMKDVDFVAIRPRLQQFMTMFGDMHEGDRVWLDHVPGEGTRVTVNGELRGSVPGEDFNAALLGVWLGDEPVTEGLKKALLGADN